MTVKTPVYMDYNSTTPVDPRVVETMKPYLTDKFGNAASRSHQFGWIAEEAVDYAREQVAKLIGATPPEVIFTSGATESDNLALKGVAHMYGMTDADKYLIDALAQGHANGTIKDAASKVPARLGSVDLDAVREEGGAFEFFKKKGDHIITLETEHKAILDSAKRLEKEGYRVTYLGVEKDGLVDLDKLKAAITDQTILVSIMMANNEIGVIQDVKAIGELCRANGVLFHTDAVQAVGKVPIDVNEMNIDLLSISGHKMYGPKGVGAIYVRRRKPRVRLEAAVDGGGHERGMRSGTLNVAGIVGLGRAAELCREEMGAEAERSIQLRQRLYDKLSELDSIYVNGHAEHRLPGNLNVSFEYVEGEALIMAIKDVAVSSGSACTSASLEPSYVLRALGVGDELAHSSIRFGIGRFTTVEEVDYVGSLVVDAVRRLREMSPLYEMAQEGIDLSTIEWAAH